MESKTNGTESLESTQNFIAKLYEYRTKIDLDHENKKGLESTKYLEKGQRLRIILKGKGVFVSEILSVGHELIIRLPLQKNVRVIDGNEWVTKDISVYLWRKGDASYVFDTRVTNSGVFQGQSVIYLAHTNQLERAQKRKSVRAECQIYAHLYFIESEVPEFDTVEVDEGYKCLLEDISEDGAMIRIGGQGRQNIKIKIQFEIDGKFIVMFGVVRAVEYNPQQNQSRLHFECLHIEKEMKNAILAFIYRDLSEEKKDELQAIAELEEENSENTDNTANTQNTDESQNPQNQEKTQEESANFTETQARPKVYESVYSDSEPTGEESVDDSDKSIEEILEEGVSEEE